MFTFWLTLGFFSVWAMNCCCSVAKSCSTLCDPCGLYSTPYLLELAQTHVHWVSDAIQISSSVTPFSSCHQSFPASGSFPVSRLFASGGQGTLEVEKYRLTGFFPFSDLKMFLYFLAFIVSDKYSVIVFVSLHAVFHFSSGCF